MNEWYVCRSDVPCRICGAEHRHDGRTSGYYDIPPVLRFNEYGDFAALLNNSPHFVVYRNLPYPTALHLFEARKFLDHRPDLAEQIRRCERVEWVTMASGQFAAYTRRDWGSIGIRTVSTLSFFFTSMSHFSPDTLSPRVSGGKGKRLVLFD